MRDLRLDHRAAMQRRIVQSPKFPSRKSPMKIAACVLAAAVSSVASATFVEFYTVKTQTSNSGVNLDVYVLYARFDSATDTIVNAFNFNGFAGATTTPSTTRTTSTRKTPASSRRPLAVGLRRRRAPRRPTVPSTRTS